MPLACVVQGYGVVILTDVVLILFDLNGVLYRYDRDARIAHLATITGRAPDFIRTAIWDSGFEDSGDSGAFDADAYLHGFGQRLGAGLSEQQWLDALQASVSPIPQTLSLLGRIRPAVRCAVLTNNNLLVRRHFAGLFPEVAVVAGDRAAVSAEFGVRKPDPLVYLRCLARLGVAPADALFIDDSQTNVAGSRSAGLQGLDYTGPAELEAALQAHGLLV